MELSVSSHRSGLRFRALYNIPEITWTALVTLKGTFLHFITLYRAEALDAGSGKDLANDDAQRKSPAEVDSWVPLCGKRPSSPLFLEMLFWLAAACYTFVVRPHHTWDGIN